VPAVTVTVAVVKLGGVAPDGSISKLYALEVPPPGAGVCTVTVNTPAEAISAAVTCAVSCVALAYVVASAVEPHITVDLLVKFDPFTVSGNAAEPATANAGDTLLIDGRGAETLIEKLDALEVPPPGAGVCTVTEAVPAVATCNAVTCAVSCVAFT